jgi:hypothetical protein
MEKMYKPVNGEKTIVDAEGVVAAKKVTGEGNEAVETFESQVRPIGEHPTNFEAYVNDQVGQYQGDTDHMGTVMGASGIETFDGTSETPAEPAKPNE